MYELVLLALGDITLQDRRTGGQKDGIESEEVGRRDVESKKQPKMKGRLTSGRCVGPLKAARSYHGEIFRKGAGTLAPDAVRFSFRDDSRRLTGLLVVGRPHRDQVEKLSSS